MKVETSDRKERDHSSEIRVDHAGESHSNMSSESIKQQDSKERSPTAGFDESNNDSLPKSRSSQDHVNQDSDD